MMDRGPGVCGCKGQEECEESTLYSVQFKPMGLVKESKEPVFGKVDECVITREEKERVNGKRQGFCLWLREKTVKNLPRKSN